MIEFNGRVFLFNFERHPVAINEIVSILKVDLAHTTYIILHFTLNLPKTCH